jgi:hypothetical protein
MSAMNSRRLIVSPVPRRYHACRLAFLRRAQGHYSRLLRVRVSQNDARSSPDEARRIAANIAKLPDLLPQPPGTRNYQRPSLARQGAFRRRTAIR